MTSTQPTANTPPLDEKGFIAAHAPCITCKYELRGLLPTGNCPECGTPVESSASGLLLRCVPLPTLRRLRTGLWLVVSSYACMVSIVFIVAMAWASSTVNVNPPMHVARLLLDALLVAGVLTITFRPSANPGSESALARGVFSIVSFCLILSAAASLLAQLGKSVEWSREKELGVNALHAFSAGAMGAGLCGYVGRIIRRFGHGLLGVAGYCLAMCFGMGGALGSLASLVLADGRSPEREYLVSRLSPFGVISMGAGVVGALIFLPLVLRVVSAEQRIAREWQDSSAGKPRPATSN